MIKGLYRVFGRTAAAAALTLLCVLTASAQNS